MKYFNGIYTLYEIAINHNMDYNKLSYLMKLMNQKDIEAIKELYPELVKFIPYCEWFSYEGKDILGMSAYMYDLYKETGILPDLRDYDINPDINKLEHWEYINPILFEINPETDFEFAEKIFPDCNIWNLFLSGSARIDYYEGKKTSLEQRIKYAIVEYMTRRLQFYSTDDFVDNDILHKKYNKKESEDNGK